MTYTGICIGGPKAGESIESETARIRMPVFASVSDPLPEGDAVGFSVHEYRFEPVRTSDGEVGFWIPQGRSTRWGFEQLAEAYANVREISRLRAALSRSNECLHDIAKSGPTRALWDIMAENDAILLGRNP